MDLLLLGLDEPAMPLLSGLVSGLLLLVVSRP
jgi:hypothetical protein